MGKCVDLLILLVALAMRSAANSGHWAKTPMIQEWKEKVAVSDRTVFKKINQREIDEHEIMEGPGRGKGEECDYFLREDLVTALGSYDIGTAGCTGDSECQFLTLRDAKNFCSSQVDCKTIVARPDVDGTHCAGGLGCFTPRNGEPEVGGTDEIYEYLCKDCSCTEVEATSTGTTFGKCQHDAETNAGWWLYGPICYVNEPTTCPEQTSYPYYRRSTLNQMFYSWEACEQNFNHMHVWEEEWKCENNVPKGTQTQLACQQLCVDDPECVGISHNTWGYKHECFLCHDEIMEPLGNDHGEYFRMPPPIHCEWNDWVEGECSAPCGTGERTNVRDKKVVEQYRGACSDVYDFTEMCEIKKCPVDCEWNPWVLGECSESCGKGTRIDTRTKKVTEAHGGECETVDTLDTITEDCNLQECPVDCVWGPWVHDAGCILDNGKVCGDGMQTATRDMVIDAYYPGKPCEGDSSKVEACSIECPACSWKQTGGCVWYGTREPTNDKSCDQTILKGQSGYCDCGDEYGTKAMKKDCEDGEFDTCDLACADHLCFADNLDSYGNDIQSAIEGITSAAACQELCNSNADCNYFTYGNTVLSGKCWLKSVKATALTSYPGVISGPKTCEWDLNAHSTECGTTTDEVFKGYKPSISDCSAACKSVSKYFVFGTQRISNDDCDGGCCNDDGECKCYCETASSCVKTSNNGYDLYEFKTKTE